MIKKYLIFAIGILFFIIILFISIQSFFNKKPISTPGYLTPTPLISNRSRKPPSSPLPTPITSSSYQKQIILKAQQNPHSLNSEEIQKLHQILQHSLPVDTSDFNLDYSARLKKYVLFEKSEAASVQFNLWLEKHPEFKPILPIDYVIHSKQPITKLHEALDIAEKTKLTPEEQAKKDADTFISILNTLLSFPQNLSESLLDQSQSSTSFQFTPLPTPTPISFTPSLIPKKLPIGSGGYVYYSQLGDQTPLPNGCTINDAGCGPTTVAMIVSSYVDSSFDPKKAVSSIYEESKQMNLPMGCEGTYLMPINTYLSKRNDLQVSDYILKKDEGISAQEAAQVFRGYIDAGWTIFVLANFKINGGGHYFWVTDISENDEILAYDPAYGTGRPTPFNENQYSPAPYYRYAFAVKKK